MSKYTVVSHRGDGFLTCPVFRRLVGSSNAPSSVVTLIRLVLSDPRERLSDVRRGAARLPVRGTGDAREDGLRYHDLRRQGQLARTGETDLRERRGRDTFCAELARCCIFHVILCVGALFQLLRFVTFGN